MSGKVIVFGSINLDLVAGVERIAAPGETVPALSFATFPGGKGGNQALAAHRAGAQVALVGKVGDDGFGRRLLGFYRKAGLSTEEVSLSADQPTGCALIQVEEASGENSIVVVPGANHDFTTEDMERVEITSGDVVLSQFEVPLGCIAALFRRACAGGARTILNPAPAQEADPALLEAVSVLVVNEQELAALSGQRISEQAGEEEIAAAARAVAARGPATVVVTLGRRGVLAVEDARVIQIPGRAVKAVDTTGAGDCFVGALAAALVRTDTLDRALAFANAAASLSVQKAGAGPSMPEAVEITAALRGEGA